MRRFLKILIIVFILTIVTIITLKIMAQEVRNELTQKKETEHFVFYSSLKDEYLLNYIPDTLEKNYVRISTDLRAGFKAKIPIWIYPDPKHYRMSFGNPLPWPSQVGGSAGDKEITVVSPDFLPYYTNIENALTHEMAHLVKNEINPEVKGGWLSEGISTYEADRIDDYWITAQLSDRIKEGKIPTLKDLDRYTYQQFVENKGYEFSFTMVKFIVEVYGYDKLVELVKTPEDYEKVFSISKDEFYTKWLAYIKDAYL